MRRISDGVKVVRTLAHDRAGRARRSSTIANTTSSTRTARATTSWSRRPTTRSPSPRTSSATRQGLSHRRACRCYVQTFDGVAIAIELPQRVTARDHRDRAGGEGPDGLVLLQARDAHERRPRHGAAAHRRRHPHRRDRPKTAPTSNAPRTDGPPHARHPRDPREPAAFDAALAPPRPDRHGRPRCWPSTRPAARRSSRPRPRWPNATPRTQGGRRRQGARRRRRVRPPARAGRREEGRDRPPRGRGQGRGRRACATSSCASRTCPCAEVPDGAGRERQRRAPPLGHAPQLRLHAAGALRHPGRQAGHGLRDRRQALRQPLRRADGRHRPRPPRARAVHARHPHRPSTG